MGVLLNVVRAGEHSSKRLAAGKLGAVVKRYTMMSPQKRYNDVRRLMQAL